MFVWDNYWAEFRQSNAEKWLVEERHKIIIDYISKVNKEHPKVIEMGCGFGSNIKLINKRVPKSECHALDNSKESLKLLNGEIKNKHLLDCRCTEFNDNTFDIIFSSGLMEHFKNEDPFIKEMKRLLKPGGFLITFVPARYSIWQLYLLLKFRNPPFGYEKSYTDKKLRTLFENFKMSVVDIVGIDPFSINAVIMKLSNRYRKPIITKSLSKNCFQEIGIIVKK